MKKLFIAIISLITVLNTRSQNVGIGTSAPAYKLDIAGRLRLRNSASTAGIWFDEQVYTHVHLLAHR
jgi:hypothetical protein